MTESLLAGMPCDWDCCKVRAGDGYLHENSKSPSHATPNPLFRPPHPSIWPPTVAIPAPHFVIPAKAGIQEGRRGRRQISSVDAPAAAGTPNRHQVVSSRRLPATTDEAASIPPGFDYEPTLGASAIRVIR